MINKKSKYKYILMSYQDKYIKYKNKYLGLKQEYLRRKSLVQNGGSAKLSKSIDDIDKLTETPSNEVIYGRELKLNSDLYGEILNKDTNSLFVSNYKGGKAVAKNKLKISSISVSEMNGGNSSSASSSGSSSSASSSVSSSVSSSASNMNGLSSSSSTESSSSASNMQGNLSSSSVSSLSL